jgi:hypothetical protein
MDRLSEKLAKAAGVAGRISSKIEARADILIAREGDLEKRTEQVFSPHEGILADAEKGLDAVERQLALLSNDPLGSSGGSPEVEQFVTVPGGSRCLKCARRPFRDPHTNRRDGREICRLRRTGMVRTWPVRQGVRTRPGQAARSGEAVRCPPRLRFAASG